MGRTAPPQSRLLAALAVCFAASLTAGTLLSAQADRNTGAERETKLTVAIFAWLPDAAAALENLEERFEGVHPTMDLELELWDPYKNEVGDDGLKQIRKFDVVEIDICRLNELVAGSFGGLDRLPADLRQSPESHVGAARTVLASDKATYVVPHWVCSNFLAFWSDNNALRQAETFDDILGVLNPDQERPLFADLCGASTLGEHYADAVLDLHGRDFAERHLRELSNGNGQLNDAAASAVMSLAAELLPRYRSHLKYFHDLNWVYPRHFANARGGALLGYSERLYYAQRELQLEPDSKLPIIKAKDIVVRQFPFGATSRGTPSWVDGFVVPKRKLDPKAEAVASFIRFAVSEEGYLAFIEPTAYQPSTYLLPAHVNGYSESIVSKQPAIAVYRDALDEGFPVDSREVWQGLRAAGAVLEKRLTGQS